MGNYFIFLLLVLFLILEQIEIVPDLFASDLLSKKQSSTSISATVPLSDQWAHALKNTIPQIIISEDFIIVKILLVGPDLNFVSYPVSCSILNENKIISKSQKSFTMQTQLRGETHLFKFSHLSKGGYKTKCEIELPNNQKLLINDHVIYI